MATIISNIQHIIAAKPVIFTVTAGLLASIILMKTSNEIANFKKFTLPDLQYEVITAKKPIKNPIRRVLITGGNGFLGKHIVTLLLKEANIDIIVLDVVIPTESARYDSVTYVKANLLKIEQLEKVFTSYRDIDSVSHVASIIPYLGVPDKALWLVNVQGTQNMVDIAKKYGVKSFIYTSSATVVLSKDDPNSRVITEEASPYPAKHMDKYTEAKEAAEVIVKAASNVNGMVACSLRPSAIFGKGDKLVSDNCVRGKDAILIGYPDVMMDWVAVESVASAHVLAEKALQDPNKRKIMHGQEYFIGSNEEVSYGDFFGYGPKGSMCHWGHPCAVLLPIWLVDTLATINGVSYAILGFPLLAASLSHSTTAYTRRHYTFSSKKAGQHFGYQPLYSVRDAIKRLVDDYQSSMGNSSKK